MKPLATKDYSQMNPHATPRRGHSSPKKASTVPSTLPARSDHAPDFIAAVQDQLGLTLQQDQALVTAFVVDNIEIPSST
jgi:uncharacterized protein (TIGR03435 family)